MESQEEALRDEVLVLEEERAETGREVTVEHVKRAEEMRLTKMLEDSLRDGRERLCAIHAEGDRELAHLTSQSHVLRSELDARTLDRRADPRLKCAKTECQLHDLRLTEEGSAFLEGELNATLQHKSWQLHELEIEKLLQADLLTEVASSERVSGELRTQLELERRRCELVAEDAAATTSRQRLAKKEAGVGVRRCEEALRVAVTSSRPHGWCGFTSRMDSACHHVQEAEDAQERSLSELEAASADHKQFQARLWERCPRAQSRFVWPEV